jgi:hypothetical protein
MINDRVYIIGPANATAIALKADGGGADIV